MSFPTQDGKKKFGSGFKAKKYDEFHSSEKTPTEPKETSKVGADGFSKKSQPSVDSTSSTKGMHLGGGSPEEHDENAEGHTEENGEAKAPEEIVAEHGKAKSVHVHHDHTNGKHHVVSHHEDGSMHTSDHDTAEAANEHAKKLGGEEGTTPSEPGSTPDAATASLGGLGSGSIFGGQ